MRLLINGRGAMKYVSGLVTVLTVCLLGSFQCFAANIVYINDDV